MPKRTDWSLLGILKVIPMALALATGSLTTLKDAVFLTSGVTLEPHAAWWAWLRVCLVISFGVTWFQLHRRIKDLGRRLTPRIQIRGLTRRVWPVERHGFTGAEYYFEVFNLSEAEALEGVRAEVIEMHPDVIGYLPVPLHIKHDTYETREFSVNPASGRQVDLITGPVSDPKSQRVIVIPHTVNKERHYSPLGRYTLVVKVSANNSPPIMSRFEAWVDDAGELRCVEL